MKKKTLSRREREKLMHRSQMLEAALQLFSEKGYHNVSMHEIAEKSEFAIGTLYKFFRNKEDLYKALIMEKSQQYHQTLMEVIQRDEDVVSILKNYIAAKAELFTGSIDTIRLYFAETRGASFNIGAGMDRDIRRMYDEFLKQFSQVLKRGIREKVLRRLSPYYMAVAIEGLTNAFLFCWLEDPERHPYDANVPVITDIFLKGVLAK